MNPNSPLAKIKDIKTGGNDIKKLIWSNNILWERSSVTESQSLQDDDNNA